MTLEQTPGSGETPAGFRALLVGTTPRLRAAVDALSAPELSVSVDDRSTPPDPDSLAFAEADCALVDDPSVATSIAVDCGDGPRSPVPTVVLTPEDETSTALATGAVDDVVAAGCSDDGRILWHRLERAIAHERTAQELDRRERLSQAVAAHADVRVEVVDGDGRRRYVDREVEEPSPGGTPTPIDGTLLDEAVHPTDRPDLRAALERVLDGGPETTETLEYRRRRPDGGWRVHETRLTNAVETPAVGGAIASTIDVTERRRAETDLRHTVERIQDAFFALDDEWRFTYLNERAEEVLGEDEDSLLGRPFLDAFPEATGTPFQTVPVEAMRANEPRTIEAYSDDLDAWIEARVFPSESGLSAYFRDVTDRVERERALAERTERLEALVQHAPVALFVLDEHGTITLSEGRALDAVDIDPGAAVGESIFDLLESVPESRLAVSRALAGEPVTDLFEVEDRIFDTWFTPITDDDGTVDRVIGVAVDETERVQYERALGTLQEATSELLTVESVERASEYVVDVAADVLEPASVAFYRYDEETNSLEPAFVSETFHAVIGDPIEVDAGEGLTWQAYRSGDAAMYRDIQSHPSTHPNARNSRSALFVPLGDHGVVVAVTPEVGSFDDDTFELARLLGATTEVALDRIDRSRRLQRRERELQDQNDRLERINRASRLREDIEGSLLLADSHEAIERDVCERVLELSECTFAWISEPDPGGNVMLRRTAAGVDAGYLDAVEMTTVDDPAAEPTGRAAKSRRPVQVDNVASTVHDGAWQSEALSRGFQSVLSVPIVYEDFLYGVLTAYADQVGGFDDAIVSTVSDLGDRIGYAIDAVRRKQARVAGSTTEIEVAVENHSPLVALAGAVDASVELQTVLSDEEERLQVVLGVAADVDPGTIADVDGVDPGSELQRIEGRTVLQVALDDDVVETLLDLHGDRVRQLSADAAGMTTVVDVPSPDTVREALSELTRRGLDVTLLARRERESSAAPAAGGRPHRLLDDLTDRQLEVVQTAYYGGYFEWPRETTGESIAASLDISPPAFHNHVRTAERKLFEALFETGIASG